MCGNFEMRHLFLTLQQILLTGNILLTTIKRSMRVSNLLKTMLPVMALMLFSCFDLDDESQLGLSDSEYDLAIPLVNSKITVGRLSEESKGNTGIKLDADGKVTLVYKGEVLRKNSAAIFPPFPGIVPFPIVDTLTNVKLLPGDKYIVKKAIFNETNINFSVEHSLAQDVKVKMKILELSKDGKGFEKDFTIKYNNALPVKYQTENISVDGWTIQTGSNSITFNYEATTPDGTKVKFDKAFMNFDVIKFSYIDGYLGFHDFPIDGNIIDIGLFDSWLSGSFDFEDPKITLSIDNAFGLPVRSKVNKMELTSITGKTVSLQSPFVTSGIDFAYPLFSELGQIKTTNFDFNNENSNIREIFNEKTKTISYNMSALVNPEKDTTVRGFITGDSYFVVNVAAEIPLNGSVNELVISDTLDIDLGDLNKVIAAEFKSITTNDFPADIRMQAYFIDELGNRTDQLFKDDGIRLNAAAIMANGRTVPGKEKIDYISFDKEKIERIRKTKKLVVFGYINTTGSDQKKSLWIYDTYGLGLKLGAILKYKKN